MSRKQRRSDEVVKAARERKPTLLIVVFASLSLVAGTAYAVHLVSVAANHTEISSPRQGADTLSMKKAIGEAMKKLDNPAGSSN